MHSNFDHYLSANSFFCVTQFLSSQQLAVFILDKIQRSVITSVCLWHWNGHTRNVRKTPDKISVCSDFTDIFPQKTGLNIHINRGCMNSPVGGDPWFFWSSCQWLNSEGHLFPFFQSVKRKQKSSS